MTYPDIYMTPEYCHLFNEIDHGTHQIFLHESKTGKVLYTFILRPIEIEHAPEGYYDIISPYGYGGPVILECDPGHHPQIMNEYHEAFLAFVKDNNVVSEFVRFHPILNNAGYCRSIYHVEFNRNTVAIDLTTPDPLMDCFTSSCRNKIRTAQKNNIQIEFDFSGSTVTDFHRIYTRTMEKNDAKEFYFFPESFFQKLFQVLKGKALLINAIVDGTIVCAGLFFHYRSMMHTFLSATDPEYYKIPCKNLVYSEAAQWGKANDCHVLHLGGGYTPDPMDSLLSFKKSFARNGLCHFYIGKQIHHQAMYDALVKSIMPKPNLISSDFFPLYRS